MIEERTQELKRNKWRLLYCGLWLGRRVESVSDLNEEQIKALACIPYNSLIVPFVLREYCNGFGYILLAERFGVKQAVIRKIIERIRE